MTKIKLIIDSNNIDDYLEETPIINYSHPNIIKISKYYKSLFTNDVDMVKGIFKFVRDEISHSADINGEILTCIASDVLEHKQGICYAKSHLLAALLRSVGIPTGFCYQKLILDDETAPYLIIHGLNGVFIPSLERWIRLDARGNKIGVNSQFSLDKEQLAFPIRPELGEKDIMTVFHAPDKNVIEHLFLYKTRSELFDNLVKDLYYYGN